MEGENARHPGLDQEGPERADWTAQVRDYAIVRLDRDGRVLSWNAGAELVKGYQRQEILGRSCAVFYPPEERQEGLPQRLLAAAERDGRAEHQGWRLARGGRRFWGDLVITAVRGDSGELLGFVQVTRDRSEERRREADREHFLAGLTHDLRSPLTSIEGYAAMLAADVSDPVLGDFASRIRSNALRLMKLVDLLVEHCHMPNGGPPAQVEQVEQVGLAGVLHMVVDDLSSAAREHEVVVQDTDVVLPADPTALARVFTNLVGNAVKYSPPGSRIDVLVEPSGEAVDVVVADRGRGIDPQDRETIFEEFARGRRAHEDGGFGLGLSVVRDLVAQHGGTVRIEEGRFGGTDVTVRLPLVGAGAGTGIPGLASAPG